MKAVVAAFNQEMALVGAFSVITNESSDGPFSSSRGRSTVSVPSVSADRNCCSEIPGDLRDPVNNCQTRPGIFHLEMLSRRKLAIKLEISDANSLFPEVLLILFLLLDIDTTSYWAGLCLRLV